ncbi:MAG TPA: hypothetical protein PLA83_01460 [Deltaproteobacteria bacterium]|nr:hypothetical protein [Deltaproteobacteria bacterium]HQI01025.1 hypothetical protein [Deltaproteobacteria bacterium]HQJ08251.1 hypothetical protein [Deltaproteobacteria bacterium]
MNRKEYALFSHGECGSKFFTEPNDYKAREYKGRCPNPSCNMQVVLIPEELFQSIDNARRAYIKEVRRNSDFIFWRT